MRRRRVHLVGRRVLSRKKRTKALSLVVSNPNAPGKASVIHAFDDKWVVEWNGKPVSNSRGGIYFTENGAHKRANQLLKKEKE